MRWMRRIGAGFILCLAVGATSAAEFPAPVEGDWVARDFRFHSGQTMDVRLHYRTIGNPNGIPVLLLHGTGGSGASFLNEAFGGALFAQGRPLDASRYFIILPDALGAGKSAKPSDGMKARFPHYTYDDMVRAQYRLVTEGLGIRHLRLVLGNSMGGMHTWLWGVKWPGMMDALVPLASQPAAMSGRNWMLRRMMVETVKADPAYRNGDYAQNPPSLRLALAFYGLASSGGEAALQAAAPTRAAADAIVDRRLAAGGGGDANDIIWQYDAARDYDPGAELGRITARVLAVNSADDERNPHQTGVMTAAMAKIARGELFLIPAGPQTSGHGTTGRASLWQARLQGFLDSLSGWQP